MNVDAQSVGEALMGIAVLFALAYWIVVIGGFGS